MDDDNEPRYTITVFTTDGKEVFNSCTDLETNDRQLTFRDKSDKTHEFYGVDYHIQGE